MSSSFMRNLNCIASQQQQHYGSIDTIASAQASSSGAPKLKHKKKVDFLKKIRRIRKRLSTKEDYAIAYESCPEDLDERTRLIKKKKKERRHSITTLDDESAKQVKSKVTSIKDFLSYKTSPPKDTDKKSKKKKKKKSSFLKRTGKFIVRTCRMMTYSSPYGTHIPPDFLDPISGMPRDYRFYDFEKGEYEYGYSNGYMGYTTYTPSVFF